MRKCLNLFAADADQWEADGMSLSDEDALIGALWRWYRGRADADGLSVTAKVLYSSITKRLEASEPLHEARSAAGKKGNEVRWGATRNGNHFANRKTIAELTSPTTTSSAPSSNPRDMRGIPEPPCVSVEDLMQGGGEKSGGKAARFVKPTVDEVCAYCTEQGFVDVDPGEFVDCYTAKGWTVGRSPMKDWKAAVRNWHRRNQSGGSSAPAGSVIHNASRKESDYVL